MRKTVFVLMAFTALTLTSCEDEKDNKPPIVNEEELITTVRMNFVSQIGGNEAVFQFRDTDGDGGAAPVIINDTLQQNTVYNVSVHFLNETSNPITDLTTEIMEEGTDHQVFFVIDSVLGLSFQYNDMDFNDYPVGAHSIFTAGMGGSGQMKVILRHQPDKSAAGVEEGKIENAGGETDVEVTFDVTIQ